MAQHTLVGVLHVVSDNSLTLTPTFGIWVNHDNLVLGCHLVVTIPNSHFSSFLASMEGEMDVAVRLFIIAIIRNVDHTISESGVFNSPSLWEEFCHIEIHKLSVLCRVSDGRIKAVWVVAKLLKHPWKCCIDHVSIHPVTNIHIVLVFLGDPVVGHEFVNS